MTTKTFVIVGAGQAGANAAAELRRKAFDGQIVVIGDELHAPYERPPLSKGMLLEPENTRCSIFADNFYAEQQIDLRLGVWATQLDAAAHTLLLADGASLSFDKLLIATGSRARRLPLLDNLGEGVHVLRTLDDAEKVRAELKPGRQILLVGGGVIGLELASSTVALGAHATVIEASDALMGRAPAPLRSWLSDLHRARGVEIHLGIPLVGARREAGKIVLELQNGTILHGDAVIYGIGAQPCTELAEAAGLKISGGGVATDASGRTSHPDIFAAGDVASQWNEQAGQFLRRETWENANRQAITAARAMLGIEEAETGVPWFWTDQCDKNIQMAGDVTAPEWLVRGATTDDSFSWVGLRDGVTVGAVTVNKGREMRNLKALIASG